MPLPPSTTAPSVPDSPLARVLSRIADAHPYRNGWKARCPAHDDQHPSLGISEGDDGKVLLHCRTGCSTELVVAALGLTMADLFPAPVAPRKAAAPVTRYEIRNRSGELVAVHARRELPGGKQLWWERPGFQEHGLHGLPTAALPLYRQEQLDRLPEGSTVVLNEGEKAADAAARAGYVSLGTVTGASATPAADVLQELVSYDVVLLPDNDPQGREHMRKTADTLLSLGGAVRWLELPGLPEKGDAADFHDTDEELRALVGAAASYAQPSVDEGPCNCPKCADQIHALEAENAALRARWSLQQRALQNKHLKTVAPVALALLHERDFATAQGKTTPDGFVRIWEPAIAERTGRGSGTVGKAAKKLAELGLCEKRSPYGEDGYRHLEVRFPAPTEEMMERLARFDPAETDDPERFKSWGGKRVRRCPDHPDADIVKDTHWFCAECGQVVDETHEVLHLGPSQVDSRAGGHRDPAADFATVEAKVEAYDQDDGRPVDDDATEHEAPAYVNLDRVFTTSLYDDLDGRPATEPTSILTGGPLSRPPRTDRCPECNEPMTTERGYCCYACVAEITASHHQKGDAP